MDEKAVHDRRWVALGVLCLSLLVVGLDNTILSVAIPSLASDLDATTSQLQWIIDGYVLVFAGLLLTAGSLGDRFGRRSALSVGLIIFVAGSIASAYATSADRLIATRSVMGLGAALIMPATLSLLTNIFTDPRERARAIGIWAGVSGIGVAIGPMLGGWLLTHFSWGSVFLVNVPVVALALPAGYFLLPNSRARNRPRLDPLGAALSIVGLTALVWAIIEAPGKGWTSTPVLIAFAIGALTLTVFVWWQATTDHPMLDVRFFRNPRFSAANLAITLTFFAMMGSMFVLTQFMQFVLGYTPLEAGVRAVPLALALLVVAPLSSRLVERFGTKKVVATGLGIVALGLAVASTATPELGYGRIFPAQILLGVGIALAMAPATESVMGSLPRDKAGVGSAMNDTTRQVGGALGVAIIGSIFSSRYTPAMEAAMAPMGLPERAVEVSRDSIAGALIVAQRLGGDPATIDTPIGVTLADAAHDAFAASMGRSLLVAAVVALAGAVVALVYLPAREGGSDAGSSAPSPAEESGTGTVPTGAVRTEASATESAPVPRGREDPGARRPTATPEPAATEVSELSGAR